MPLLRPLRALRYGADHADRLDLLVTPSTAGEPTDRTQVGDVHPLNIRRLVRGDDGDLATADEPPFTHADRLLDRWKQDGVLVRDARPSFYVLEQDSGLARRGLVCLVRLSPFEDGIVLPHEETRGGSKQQLLAQLRATKTQLSLVMAMVPDRAGALRDFLGSRDAGAVVDVVDGDGVRNRLWREEDPAAQLALSEALREEPAVIADGHHRYEAALAWQAEAAGRGHRERPSDYVMVLLVPVDDPGLACKATHRVLEEPLSPAAEKELAALDRDFDVEELPDTPALEAFLRNPGGHRFGLVRPGRRLGLRLKDDVDLSWIAAPLQDVDAELARRLILDPLGWSGAADQTGRSGSSWGHNRASAHDVAERVAAGHASLALLMRPPRAQQVLRVALDGAVMPPKSTNFVPKPAKGILMASLRSF
jgi:uncharacterized protein (DUF1015 family)